MERRPTGHLAESHYDYAVHKLTAIAEAQAAGRVRAGDPFDIMAMVIAMSMTWSPVSNVYAADSSEPESVHESRRNFLRECVGRAVTPK